MTHRAPIRTRAVKSARLCGWLCLGCIALPALSTAQQIAAGAQQGLDQVVAVVNGEPILASDLEREIQLERCKIGESKCDGVAAPTTVAAQHEAMERLIDRELILQQMKQLPQAAVWLKPGSGSSGDACARSDAQSKELEFYGLTQPSLREYCALESNEFSFIEQRFRGSIHIRPEEVASYYREQFVPEYRKVSPTPPPLRAIEGDITKLLVEREISSLMEDWLRALRAQSQILVAGTKQVTP